MKYRITRFAGTLELYTSIEDSKEKAEICARAWVEGYPDHSCTVAEISDDWTSRITWLPVQIDPVIRK